MKQLRIPEPLKVEFATVEAIWISGAETRRVDSLLLAWIKYEKQLRRLFCFLVYLHPKINEKDIDDIIKVMAKHDSLYPENFIKAIEALRVTSIPALLGDKYDSLWADVVRIKDHRNKLMHGQLTGKKIKSPHLERDVQCMIDWISALGAATQAQFGYDGIQRKTFKWAKQSNPTPASVYPFRNAEEFKYWLKHISKKWG